MPAPSNPSTNPISAKNAGVFANNKSKPIHRWYPFVEGYSAELVEWGIQSTGSSCPRILDPFGGSGTTSLAAAESGLDSWFCEVNPFMAWLADVKVNKSQRVGRGKGLTKLIELHALTQAGGIPQLTVSDDVPLMEVDRLRGFFPEGVALEVCQVLEWLQSETSGAAREVGRAAVAAAIIPSSSMVRRTDLRRRTPKDPQPRPFAALLSATLQNIIEDLESAGGRLGGTAYQIAGDARTVQPVDSGLFDLVVTSPPYLNGTNYFRNTKLELLTLDFIKSEGDLAAYRNASITAGINNVTKRREEPDLIDAVETVAMQLDQTTYDKRIPQLVRLYFSDMRKTLSALRTCVTDSADLLLDIGDSRFAGIHVPTDALLAEVAGQVGWTLTESVPVRDRRSYDGGKLTQVVLKMKAS